MSEAAGLKVVTGALVPLVRPRSMSSTTSEDDMAHRLALWLADVSAEATFAQMSPEVTVAPQPTGSMGPSLAGSPP